MSFVKSYNINGTWVPAVITDEEEKEAIDACRKSQIQTMKDCIEDTIEVGDMEEEAAAKVAVAFFNKRGIKLQVEREKIARSNLGMA